MQLTSPAFNDTERIPAAYTCDEDRLHSPALLISDVPEGARSLALIMDDPDVSRELRPDGHFTHWILFNIPPETDEIPERATLGTPGTNTRGENAYMGPCPPPDYEPTTHRYIFTLYALDTTLDLSVGVSKKEVEHAMEGHVLTTATLTGTYSRA